MYLCVNFKKLLMRYFRIFCLVNLLLLMSNNYAQKVSNSCPRNFDGKAYVTAKKTIKKQVGKMIAFDAEVIAVEKGYNDLPYFSVSLDNGQQLWISSMMSNINVDPGHKLRILGYLAIVQPDDEIGMAYNKKGIEVRAFAILDIQTKALNYADVFEKEALLWKSGKIPE